MADLLRWYLVSVGGVFPARKYLLCGVLLQLLAWQQQRTDE